MRKRNLRRVEKRALITLIFCSIFNWTLPAVAAQVSLRLHVDSFQFRQDWMPLSGAAIDPRLGLDAQGIDGWTAWQSGQGLEVRDALNRVVSPQRIEVDVREGMVREARRLAVYSTLPKAAIVMGVIDTLKMALVAIQTGVPWWPRGIVLGLGRMIRPSPKGLAWQLLFFSLILATGPVAWLARSCRPLCHCPRLIPLRC